MIRRWLVVESYPPVWAGAERVDGDEYPIKRCFTRKGAELVASIALSFRVVDRRQWEAERDR